MVDDFDPPRRKKKKRSVSKTSPSRRRSGEARPAVATPHAVAAPDGETFSRGHLMGALVVGLALGGVLGYAFRGDGETPTADRGGSPSEGATAQPGADARPAPRAQQQRPGAQAPDTAVYIPLASHSPRKGPEHAKVTILDFSDFQ